MAGNDDDQREAYTKYKSGLKEVFNNMGLLLGNTLSYGRVKDLMKKLQYKDPTAAMEARFPGKDQNSTLSFDEFFSGVLRDFHNNADKISMEKDEAKAASAFEQYKTSMKAFFQKADTSGDGMLSYEEVVKIFKDMELEEHEIESWVPNITEDSQLSFDQFWTGIETLEDADEKFTELQMRYCYLKHDVDKNGYLWGMECRNALVEQGWTEASAERCWQDMDFDCGEDNKVSMYEWLFTVGVY